MPPRQRSAPKFAPPMGRSRATSSCASACHRPPPRVWRRDRELDAESVHCHQPHDIGFGQVRREVPRIQPSSGNSALTFPRAISGATDASSRSGRGTRCPDRRLTADAAQVLRHRRCAWQPGTRLDHLGVSTGGARSGRLTPRAVVAHLLHSSLRQPCLHVAHNRVVHHGERAL